MVYFNWRVSLFIYVYVVIIFYMIEFTIKSSVKEYMFRIAKFEVATAVLVKILVFRDPTPSQLVNGLQRSKGHCAFIFSLTLKKKAPDGSTLLCLSTQRNVPEDVNLTFFSIRWLAYFYYYYNFSFL